LDEFLAGVAGPAEVMRYHEHCVSGDELAHASAQVAAGLAQLDVSHGDRAALWLPQNPAELCKRERACPSARRSRCAVYGG
jgi:acyl-CoA synthetase (AMP-forming)/AMP-acid ligase II